jgi:hypothetical protein
MFIRKIADFRPRKLAYPCPNIADLRRKCGEPCPDIADLGPQLEPENFFERKNHVAKILANVNFGRVTAVTRNILIRNSGFDTMLAQNYCGFETHLGGIFRIDIWGSFRGPLD